MELRHIRYFLAVADELNFTRAARRLNIAQPPLTQQIKALEGEIGVALFDRSNYRIELTAAGKVFAAEVADILGDVRNAVLRARRAARGTFGQVRVGFTESASFNACVPRSFREFRVACPEVELLLEEHQSTELAAALRNRHLDAAFVRPPLRCDDELTLHMLDVEDMVVAVPAEHRLAGRSEVELSELAAETFILYPRAERPGLADTVMHACERAGFTAHVGQYTPQLSSTINLVAASLGISIVPASMQGLRCDAVAYLSLCRRPLRAQLGIAHRAGEESRAVLRFVEIARESAAAPTADGSAASNSAQSFSSRTSAQSSER
jgi:DNA-binding transcriptional LysR family regulator